MEISEGEPGTVVEYLHLCPEGPGLNEPFWINRMERQPRNSLPETSQCVGAFGAGYVL
jgi:hypothetical protein